MLNICEKNRVVRQWLEKKWSNPCRNGLNELDLEDVNMRAGLKINTLWFFFVLFLTHLIKDRAEKRKIHKIKTLPFVFVSLLQLIERLLIQGKIPDLTLTLALSVCQISFLVHYTVITLQLRFETKNNFCFLITTLSDYTVQTNVNCQL